MPSFLVSARMLLGNGECIMRIIFNVQDAFGGLEEAGTTTCVSDSEVISTEEPLVALSL